MAGVAQVKGCRWDVLSLRINVTGVVLSGSEATRMSSRDEAEILRLRLMNDRVKYTETNRQRRKTPYEANV